jgi:hypothetical protein
MRSGAESTGVIAAGDPVAITVQEVASDVDHS